jgi:hypothetical protein
MADFSLPLVFPRGTKCLGVVPQAFEAQVAIGGGVMRFETAYLKVLLRRRHWQEAFYPS